MRTIERWHGDPKLAYLGFPQPDIINNRKYWWLTQLQHYDRMAVLTAASRPKKGRPPRREAATTSQPTSPQATQQD
jgi:hypothetical protein